MTTDDLTDDEYQFLCDYKRLPPVARDVVFMTAVVMSGNPMPPTARGFLAGAVALCVDAKQPPGVPHENH